MRNFSTIKAAALAVVGAATVLTASPVFADRSSGRFVEITITNTTRGQLISPLLVATHSRHLPPLFRLGEEARPELAALAEDANLDLLAELANPHTNRAVLDLGKIATDAGPIPPGQSASVVLRASGPFRYVTLAGMLVTTNDAFTALRARIPGYGETTVRTIAYDAGSEANNENCAFIPGPPCGNGGVRDLDEAEGFVHVHAGIHGIADLTPAHHDWRNPVAEITIRRLRKRDDD